MPSPQPDAGLVIQEFAAQQEMLSALLLRAEKINIRKAKVPTSLSRFIRLCAGDTFGFLVAHINRHMLQAERAVHTALQAETQPV